MYTHISYTYLQKSLSQTHDLWVVTHPQTHKPLPEVSLSSQFNISSMHTHTSLFQAYNLSHKHTPTHLSLSLSPNDSMGWGSCMAHLTTPKSFGICAHLPVFGAALALALALAALCHQNSSRWCAPARGVRGSRRVRFMHRVSVGTQCHAWAQNSWIFMRGRLLVSDDSIASFEYS